MGGTLRELPEGDISHRFRQTVRLIDRVVAHGIHVNVLALDRDGEGLVYPLALQLQHDRRARYAAEVVAHFGHGETFGRLAVHGENPVAGLHACTLRRLALIRVHGIRPEGVFGDFAFVPLYCPLGTWSGTLLDDGTYTAVLAGGEHTQVAVVLLGIIDRVWVYLTQHGVDSRLCQIAVVQGVHIVDIHLTHHIREDVDALVRPRGLLTRLGVYD